MFKVLTFFKRLFIYLCERSRSKQRETSFIAGSFPYWLHWPALRRQGSGPPSRSPKWMAGPQAVEISFTAFPDALGGSWISGGAAGPHISTPVWDTSTTSGLTHCAQCWPLKY